MSEKLKAKIDASKRHQWRDNYRGTSKVDADDAAKVLDSIFQRDRCIQAQAVVDEARPKASPIHEGFEWRDNVAANEHRKWQARNMVRSIEVIQPQEPAEQSSVETVEVQTAYTFAGNGNSKTPSGYYPTEVVKQDFDLFHRAMQDAQKALRSAENRVNDLKRIAKESDHPEQMAQIVIAAKSLATAQAALASVSH